MSEIEMNRKKKIVLRDGKWDSLHRHHINMASQEAFFAL
jgi:hypothetical protein